MGNSANKQKRIRNPTRTSIPEVISARFSAEELRRLDNFDEGAEREDEILDIANYLEDDSFSATSVETTSRFSRDDLISLNNRESTEEVTEEILMPSKLVGTGATLDEVITLRQEGYSIDELSKIMTPPDSPTGFTTRNLLFGSSEDGRKIGSIYFKTGRIRLFHSHGPSVEPLKNSVVHYLMDDRHEDTYNKILHIGLYSVIDNIQIQRNNKEIFRKKGDRKKFNQAEAEKEKLKEMLEENLHDIYLCLTEDLKIKELKDETPGRGKKLLEVFFNGGKAVNFHLSRGFPVDLPVRLRQVDINSLCNLAATRNNAVLSKFMSKHPLLKEIPLNK